MPSNITPLWTLKKSSFFGDNQPCLERFVGSCRMLSENHSPLLSTQHAQLLELVAAPRQTAATNSFLAWIQQPWQIMISASNKVAVSTTIRFFWIQHPWWFMVNNGSWWWFLMMVLNDGGHTHFYRPWRPESQQDMAQVRVTKCIACHTTFAPKTFELITVAFGQPHLGCPHSTVWAHHSLINLFSHKPLHNGWFNQSCRKKWPGKGNHYKW